VLGHPDVATYLDSPYYLGGVVGRYANRIADGRFDLEGRTVRVPTNDRGHALHGGPDGFDRRLWAVREIGSDQAVLQLSSPDGDMGFPGRGRGDRHLPGVRQRGPARPRGGGRPSHGREPDQPRLLQPRRRGHDPGSSLVGAGGPVDAGRRHRDPERHSRTGRRDALRPADAGLPRREVRGAARRERPQLRGLRLGAATGGRTGIPGVRAAGRGGRGPARAPGCSPAALSMGPDRTWTAGRYRDTPAWRWNRSSSRTRPTTRAGRRRSWSRATRTARSSSGPFSALPGGRPEVEPTGWPPGGTREDGRRGPRATDRQPRAAW
jgi:hypothetical protein